MTRDTSSSWWCGLAAVVAVLATASGCTKTNPDACCTTEADCAAIALPKDTTCGGADEVCVDHVCVEAACQGPSDCAGYLFCVDGFCRVCDSDGTGCGEGAPVCDDDSHTCERCAVPDDCARFPTTPLCAPDGACVACLGDEDCGGVAPVCDGGSCRRCDADAECQSLACGDDGACIDELDVLYVSPDGVDAGDCSRQAPCAGFLTELVTAQRHHFVMLPGVYYGLARSLFARGRESPGFVPIQIHATGALLHVPAGPFVRSTFAIDDDDVTITGLHAELELDNLGSCTADGVVELRSVDVSGHNGFAATDCVLRVVSSSFHDLGFALANTGGEATVERTRFERVGTGVISDTGNVLRVRNSIFDDVEEAGVQDDSDGATAIEFSTFVDVGGNTAISCQPGTQVTASIIWSTTATGGNASADCAYTDDLIGPSATPAHGAFAADPLFVDAANGDLHLQATSPAIDASAVGILIDIDGEARPKGNGFDLGADEAN